MNSEGDRQIVAELEGMRRSIDASNRTLEIMLDMLAKLVKVLQNPPKDPKK